jgi:aryl-alcohol dehydrogenase-like predicted oxidoreductase
MKMRALGTSGIEIAPLAFGGNVFGWTADEPTSFRLLDAFVDAGFNMIDTADVYSRWAPGHQGGESETIVGNWLAKGGKARRDQVIIVTKVGLEMGPGKKGLSPAYIKEAAEASLRRLRIDCIDVYLSHRDDPDTPLADTLGAYARLIEQGKIRVAGSSNYTAPRLKEALDLAVKHGLPRLDVTQPLYSLVERDTFEGALQDLCIEENVGVIGFYALASGFLTGKYRSKADMAGQTRGPRVEKYLDDRGFRILAALDAVAARHRAKPGQVALAWLLARPGLTAPIASATTPGQLKELTAAVELKLDRDDVAELDKASA